MFFALSKILAFLLQPLVWIVALLLLGILARGPKWRHWSLRLGIGLLLLFTSPIILHLALKWWEYPAVQKTEIPNKIETAIILGGYFRQTSAAPSDRFNLNEFPNRLINGLELLSEGYVDQLILSGGSGHLLYNLDSESLLVDSLLDSWCWPDSLTRNEARSRNTFENIRNSKALLVDLGVQTPVVLITSAFHMRRALAICRAQELEVIPYSTDVLRQTVTPAPRTWLIPDAKAPFIWNLLIKEWAGLIVYRIRGYAD